MHVELIPTDSVKPYRDNPRVISSDVVRKLANSLREFAWRQPIVVDKERVVVVGHARLEAAKALKMPEVPVHVADDLTEEQVAQYRLADNRLGELADWDRKMLADEMDRMGNTNALLDFGFTTVEVLANQGMELGVMEGREPDPWTGSDTPLDPDTVIGAGKEQHRIILYFDSDEERDDYFENTVAGQGGIRKTRHMDRAGYIAVWMGDA